MIGLRGLLLVIAVLMLMGCACGMPRMPDLPQELSEPCRELPELKESTMKGMLENHVEVAGLYFEECARRESLVGLWLDVSAIRR